MLKENRRIQRATQSQRYTFEAMGYSVKANPSSISQLLTLLGKREAGCTFVCWKNVITHEEASWIVVLANHAWTLDS